MDIFILLFITIIAHYNGEPLFELCNAYLYVFSEEIMLNATLYYSLIVKFVTNIF